MKNNILFITEKWCDANPNLGLTNNYHNLFSTFKKAMPESKFNIIHLDEVAVTYKTHIDSLIPKVYEKTKPDIVIFSLLGNSNLNPTFKSYNYFKEKKVKMIFMWADVSTMWGKKEIEEDLKEYADLHVCWGSEYDDLKTDTKILWLFAPQDENLYFPNNNIFKEHDVSFVGSMRYIERQSSIKYLLENGINVNVNGGQREVGLTPEAYASIIRNSKINLNFAEGPNGIFQCKGRVWEILASKSLLIEKINNATAKHLTPGVHYVPYENLEDLKNKIKYYLKNISERELIAKSGYEFYKEKYTYKHFWNEVMKNIQ